MPIIALFAPRRRSGRGYAGRREVRAVRQAAAKAIDPERDLRRAREALDTAGGAARRGPLLEEAERRAKRI